LATVLGLSHSPLRTLEPSAHPLALNRVVLHQQDARGWHVCPKPANQPTQPFAADWLGEIARRAKGDAAAVLIHDRDHEVRQLGALVVVPKGANPRPAGGVGSRRGGRNRGAPIFLRKLAPPPPPRRSRDGKSFCLEVIRNELARSSIVVDDENAIGNGR